MRTNKLVKSINTISNRDLVYKLLMPIPDKYFIACKYFLRTKKILNLKNPELFNEKIQWLKLNYRNNLMPICADKVRVREYVENKIGKSILNTVYGVYESAEQIDFQTLPNQFVIKLNNSSGDVILVHNKNEIDIDSIKSKLNEIIKVKYYLHGREWVYEEIETKIIIEKLLIENNDIPEDYKFLCINGKVETIQVDYGRHNTHKRNIYNRAWERLEVISGFPNFDEEYRKPKNLELMINYAERLAEDFPMARVDFYEYQNSVIFGEITFFPGNGYRVYKPQSFNKFLGDKLRLPNL